MGKEKSWKETLSGASGPPHPEDSKNGSDTVAEKTDGKCLSCNKTVRQSLFWGRFRNGGVCSSVCNEAYEKRTSMIPEGYP